MKNTPVSFFCVDSTPLLDYGGIHTFFAKLVLSIVTSFFVFFANILNFFIFSSFFTLFRLVFLACYYNFSSFLVKLKSDLTIPSRKLFLFFAKNYPFLFKLSALSYTIKLVLLFYSIAISFFTHVLF